MSSSKGVGPVLALVVALFLSACASAGPGGADGERAAEPPPGASGEGEGIVVSDAWARPASAGSATAVYFSARNAGPQADRLLDVESNAGVAEIHATLHEDGIASMRRVEDGVPIDAGGMLVFEPMAYHVMLSDLVEDLVEGDTLDFALRFEHGGRVEASADIRTAAP